MSNMPATGLPHARTALDTFFSSPSRALNCASWHSSVGSDQTIHDPGTSLKFGAEEDSNGLRPPLCEQLLEAPYSGRMSFLATHDYSEAEQWIEDCTWLDLHKPEIKAIDCDLGSNNALGFFGPNNSRGGSKETHLRLSDFAFLGTLGSGAHGKVLLAERSAAQTSVFSLCAVKVLKKDSMTRADAEELLHELQVLRLASSKSNPGSAFLQRFYHGAQDSEHVFLAMEYHPMPLSHPDIRSRLRIQQSLVSCPPSGLFPDCSLKRLRSSEPESPHLAVNSLRLIAAELILGLEHLHALGIVHQDIKPANIMVTAAGHVVITDFGASKTLPRVDSDSNSLDDAFYGPAVVMPEDALTFTPQYAAPELLGSYPEQDPNEVLVYDERVDFWSLAVVLRELATGEAPGIYGVSNDDTDKGAKGSDISCPTAESKVESNLDGDLDNLVKMMLVEDQLDRLWGSRLKSHPFFKPLRGLWDQIAALQHPPLPFPGCLAPDKDVSFEIALEDRDRPRKSFNMLADVHDLFRGAVAELPWDDSLVSSSDGRGDVSSLVVHLGVDDVEGDLTLVQDDALDMKAEALEIPRPQAPTFTPPQVYGFPLQDTRMANDNNFTRSSLQEDTRPTIPSIRLRAPLSPSRDCPSLLHQHPELPDPRHIADSRDYERYPLRRRAGLRDLRSAFCTSGQPIPLPAKIKFGYCSLPPEAVVWTFEQQITVAMLATMEHRPAQPAVQKRAECTLITPNPPPPAVKALSGVAGILHKFKKRVAPH